jgi:hypothetical protein
MNTLEANIKEFFGSTSYKKERTNNETQRNHSQIRFEPERARKISNGDISHLFQIATSHSSTIMIPRITLTSASSKAQRSRTQKKLLEGTGKSIRQIKIRNEKDIDEKQITAWIQEAARLNQKQTKPTITLMLMRTVLGKRELRARTNDILNMQVKS